MDELLHLLEHNGHKILEYADDLVIVAKEKYKNEVRGRI